MSRLRFEPRVLPTLATLLMLAALLRLGFWQAEKGERRAAEIAQHTQRAQLGPYAIGAKLVEPVVLQDAPVTVRGTYEPEHQFFVDNRQEDGKPGVHVVTPPCALRAARFAYWLIGDGLVGRRAAKCCPW